MRVCMRQRRNVKKKVRNDGEDASERSERRTHNSALVAFECLENDGFDGVVVHAEKLLAGMVQHVLLLALHLDLKGCNRKGRREHYSCMVVRPTKEREGDVPLFVPRRQLSQGKQANDRDKEKKREAKNTWEL